MNKLYNHAFTFGFSLDSEDESGEHVTADELRNAIVRQLDLTDDDGLRENVGLPYDTYEHEHMKG